jgi:transposase-like protein
MSKRRKRYSAKEKVVALRKHFLESVPVSDVCDEYGIQPRLFYDWQRMFFTNGERVFEQKREQGATQHQKEIARLEERLRKKDEVLAEVMEEYVALKKKDGGRCTRSGCRGRCGTKWLNL